MLSATLRREITIRGCPIIFASYVGISKGCGTRSGRRFMRFRQRHPQSEFLSLGVLFRTILIGAWGLLLVFPIGQAAAASLEVFHADSLETVYSLSVLAFLMPSIQPRKNLFTVS